MKTSDYIIANRRVRLSGKVAEVVERYISSFEPFRLMTTSETALIEISEGEITSNINVEPITTFDFDEGQAVCRF